MNSLHVDPLLVIILYLSDMPSIRCLLSSYLKLARVVNAHKAIKRQIKHNVIKTITSACLPNELLKLVEEEYNFSFIKTFIMSLKSFIKCQSQFNVHETKDYKGRLIAKYITYVDDGKDVLFHYIDYKKGKKVESISNYYMVIDRHIDRQPNVYQPQHAIKGSGYSLQIKWKYGVPHGECIAIKNYTCMTVPTIFNLHYGTVVSKLEINTVPTFQGYVYEREGKDGYCKFLVADKYRKSSGKKHLRYCSRKVMIKEKFCVQHAKKLKLI